MAVYVGLLVDDTRWHSYRPVIERLFMGFTGGEKSQAFKGRAFLALFEIGHILVLSVDK